MVEEAWPYVKDFIEIAVKQTDGRYTLEDAYKMVSDQGYLLWAALGEDGIKGAIITCFLTYPRKKSLHIMFLGGTQGHDWKAQFLKTMRKFARDQGCSAIEASGREGWSRMLKADGFKPLWHTFEIPIELGVH